MTYPLAAQGVFWTIQGEGALQGEPMAFVRLAGCSVGCPQCDTDYRVSRRVTPDELLREIQAVIPPAHKWPWVWITGGEPTDHNLQPLIDLLRTVGCRVALATSGVRKAPLVDWLSVSPHNLDCVQRTGSEVKVVPGLNDLEWGTLEEISRWSFPYRFLQPIWGDWAAMGQSLEFVRTHPGWRMSIQAHKYWDIP